MKRLFSLLLPILLLFPLLLMFFVDNAAASDTPDSLSSIDLHVTISDQPILPASSEGKTWFFLPSHADLHAVPLCFSLPEGADLAIGEARIASGDTVDVAALAAYDEAGFYYALPCMLTVNGAPQTETLYFMKSENVGAMFLTVADPAYGRTWIESDAAHKADAGKKTNVTMLMQSAGGDTVYNGKLTSLKGRGNTTWGYRYKKPYQIKLDKKTDLLSSGNSANKSKTWILLANALDKTLIRSALALDTAQYLGLRETPEYTYVNLYFDGEYRGLYQVTEKVQIGAGRVDISELEQHNTVADESATATGVSSLGYQYQYNPTAVCDTDNISGSYLLEQDNAYYRKENSWFILPDGSGVVVKSPEFCTKEQIEYISERFAAAAKAAKYGSFEGRSVEELFDLDSLASLYILNEYMLNCDFTASFTYFFLPKEGDGGYENKFYAGPAWDFDTSLGNRTEVDWMRDPDHIFRETSYMFRSRAVRRAIKQKAAALEPLGSVLFAAEPTQLRGVASLGWYREHTAAARMNFMIMPFDNTGNTFSLPTYQQNHDYVFGFLQQRHASILPQIAQWDIPTVTWSWAEDHGSASATIVFANGETHTVTDSGSAAV